MKGSFSIEYILSAVWQANARGLGNLAFSRYLNHGKAGNFPNPKDTQSPLLIGNDGGLAADEVVKEGWAFMRR